MAAVATGRVRAPELLGAGGWINTAQPLTLEQLRGRVVLLDFWTFCCINCLRVIEELRPLEERFGDRLVVIGVHSPKFPHEADHAAVERAVHRHRIHHPVLDDPDMQTWQHYGVRAWPTLVVIDPDGYVVATAAGEGNGPSLGDLIQRLLTSSGGADGDSLGAAVGAPLGPRGFSLGSTNAHPVGLLASAITPSESPSAPPRTLSFPGKVASDGRGRLAIADTGNDRVLVCTIDGDVLTTYDGFQQPQGVRFDGERLLVCDTVAGSLVEVSLRTGARRVLGDGMHSPWDVALLRDGRIAVAEAGLHRILAFPPGGGPATVLAGTKAEGLRDGPALSAHLAQPSGLSVLPDGALVIADSEVSALRVLREEAVETLVGQGLFEWGAQDGGRTSARLQHPLGVAVVEGGSIAIADTFNSLLRIWREGELRTVALDASLSEPGGVDVLPDGRVVVADTDNNRIVTVDMATGHVEELPLRDTAQPQPIHGAAGTVLHLAASVDLDGEQLDLAQGPPVRVSITADPPALLRAGPRAWAFDSLPVDIELPLAGPGDGDLTVEVVASTCHGDVCTIRRNTLHHSLHIS